MRRWRGGPKEVHTAGRPGRARRLAGQIVPMTRRFHSIFPSRGLCARCRRRTAAGGGGGKVGKTEGAEGAGIERIQVATKVINAQVSYTTDGRRVCCRFARSLARSPSVVPERALGRPSVVHAGRTRSVVRRARFLNHQICSHQSVTPVSTVQSVRLFARTQHSSGRLLRGLVQSERS